MNIIDKFTEKVKQLKGGNKSKFDKSEKSLFWALVLILSSAMSFGLGRLSKIEETRAPIKIEKATMSEESLKAPAAVGLIGEEQGSKELEKPEKIIVASKRGKKYHYLWCSGAKTIKEENKIYFASEMEAEQAGYTLAANCQK